MAYVMFITHNILNQVYILMNLEAKGKPKATKLRLLQMFTSYRK